MNGGPECRGHGRPEPHGPPVSSATRLSIQADQANPALATGWLTVPDYATIEKIVWFVDGVAGSPPKSRGPAVRLPGDARMPFSRDRGSG
jgi:hypothetical protein